MIVFHHTKYKEIHGVDEGVWMTMGEHKKLHMRLRRGKQCNIPVPELRKISMAASGRNTKHWTFSENRIQTYITAYPNGHVIVHWRFNTCA